MSFLIETIKDMLMNNTLLTCFKVADLGCSSGPNTFFGVSQIIDTIHEICQKLNCKSPEFDVFLNDLPENDFNTIFKSVPAFYQRLEEDKGDKLGSCFISGVPGSFYGRLFLSESFHFVHSSYSVHWVSKKTMISKARPFLIETIKDMLMNNTLPTCFKVADLGCSSGPNTFFLISQIIDTIHEICQKLNCKSPDFDILLNDLPENDFNTIFKSVPAFYQRLEKDKGDKLGSCFISGVPGSFYGRLFPSESLHFVHSSYSVHWVSKVPDELGNNNKGNIYLANSSLPNVYKAYLEQFQRDFSLFLRLRSEEIIPKGRMFLVFMGRSIADPTSRDCCYLWELLTKSLLDLVTEGLVKEGDVDSFNLPCYTPYKGEVKEIVESEGSFNLDKLETFEVNWDPSDDDVCNENFALNKYEKSGKTVAKTVRAVTEPMLATHFGDTIIDSLFTRYSKHVAEHLCVEKTKYTSIVISMTKK